MSRLVVPTPVLLTQEFLVNHWDQSVWHLWMEAQRMGLDPMPSYVEDRRYRIKETDWGYVELLQMAFNWRLILGDDFVYDKGWCFLGPRGLSNALAAAVEWSGEGEAPGPWYKAVHTQEIRQEHLYR